MSGHVLLAWLAYRQDWILTYYWPEEEARQAQAHNDLITASGGDRGAQVLPAERVAQWVELTADAQLPLGVGPQEVAVRGWARWLPQLRLWAVLHVCYTDRHPDPEAQGAEPALYRLTSFTLCYDPLWCESRQLVGAVNGVPGLTRHVRLVLGPAHLERRWDLINRVTTDVIRDTVTWQGEGLPEEGDFDE